MSRPADLTVSLHGVTVTICRSAGPDRAPVVFVDSTEELEGDVGSPGPQLRIHLNDSPVYVGVAYECPEERDEDVEPGEVSPYA